MNVSARGYRAYRTRPISQNQRTDMVLLAHIRDQFAQSHNCYGRVRMTEELNPRYQILTSMLKNQISRAESSPEFP